MTISLDDFEALKRKVEQARTEADQAKGALDQLLLRLKNEFAVSTLKEARILLARMHTEEIRALAKYTKAKKLFEQQWKARLGERHGDQSGPTED